MKFAIKDINTNTYVASGPFRLSHIEDAKLFDTIEEARLIKAFIANSLAWSHLEKVHNRDRWHIDIGFSDLNEALKKFSNLTIVGMTKDEVQ